ncbi:MAG: hypothetical protein ACOY3P_25720 [Planctomycetota bacterium]
MLRRCSWTACLLLATGCSVLPEISHQPTMHNPFPQLSRIAIAPFFNLSGEATLDGRKVAEAYFNELQSVPGFEVIPVGVVEAAMREHQIQLHGPAEARHLAQLLDADALVVGAVSDYSPYYPPRMALQVEWYAANPCFHAIPPGYGLPWGTPEAEDIPAPLVFEAEMALAKAQLQTQTPPFEKLPSFERASAPSAPQPTLPPKPDGRGMPDGSDPPPEWYGPQRPAAAPNGGQSHPGQQAPSTSPPAPPTPMPPPPATPPSSPPAPADPSNTEAVIQPLVHEELIATRGPADSLSGDVGFPPNWPDPRGFIPPPPLRRPPTCWPNDAPVIRHTRTYNGNDADFTEALSSYFYFRDDARFGGWQSYLQRSDDFMRFCCYMHIAETLTARGGAGETRVVWRWHRVR